MSEPTTARVLFPDGTVENFATNREAYRYWLALASNVRAAYRSIGDDTPTYGHDYVTVAG